jgi:hypothetical protein
MKRLNKILVVIGLAATLGMIGCKGNDSGGGGQLPPPGGYPPVSICPPGQVMGPAGACIMAGTGTYSHYQAPLTVASPAAGDKIKWIIEQWIPCINDPIFNFDSCSGWLSNRKTAWVDVVVYNANQIVLTIGMGTTNMGTVATSITGPTTDYPVSGGTEVLRIQPAPAWVFDATVTVGATPLSSNTSATLPVELKFTQSGTPIVLGTANLQKLPY